MLIVQLLYTTLSQTKTYSLPRLEFFASFNNKDEGLCNSQVTKMYSRWTGVCRRTLLFALALANISLKVSLCWECEKALKKLKRQPWHQTEIRTLTLAVDGDVTLKRIFYLLSSVFDVDPWIKPDLASEELSHAHAHRLPTRSRRQSPRRCWKWCL